MKESDMELIKINKNPGNQLLSACSTSASECGCKDTSGESYQAHAHQFNIVSNRKEKAGKTS